MIVLNESRIHEDNKFTNTWEVKCWREIIGYDSKIAINMNNKILQSTDNKYNIF